MTAKCPRVRDLTGKRRRWSVDVVSGPAFELLASVFVVTLGEQEVPEYEVGPDLLRRAQEAPSARLLNELEEVGKGDFWLGLVGHAYDSPEPRQVRTFLDYLSAADPVTVRRDLVAMQVHHREASTELIERAAAGDKQAVEALVALCDPECAAGLRRLLARSPAQGLRKAVSVLRRFDAEVFHGGEETAGALARDAGEKRALAGTMPPDCLVETATNGVTLTLQPEVTGVVLIPSAVTRPWVANLEHRGRRLFMYPVDEQVLGADPNAPSPWMLGFYKALADESRLRILNLLAAGPASLSQVAERLGLAKSTVIHHVRALRSAGLVLITVGAEKEYSLRTQAIPEAGRLLQAYLSGPAGVGEPPAEIERNEP